MCLPTARQGGHPDIHVIVSFPHMKRYMGKKVLTIFRVLIRSLLGEHGSRTVQI